MKINKEIVKKFIHPYIWQGFCWIDGGLGKQQAGEGRGWTVVDGKKYPNPRGVTKAVTNPLVKWTDQPGKHRVFISPTSDYFITESGVGEASLNPRYICCFAGPDIAQLHKVIEEIAELCDSQTWVFDAYIPDGVGATQQQFRLWVRQGRIGDQNFEQPCFKILAGTMVPDFSKSTDVAGW